MSVTIHYGRKVLLTSDDMQRWREEISQARALIEDRTRKLDAAAVLIGAEPESATRHETQVTSVGDWVFKVVRESDHPLAPASIRRRIEEAGGPVGSENYIYTAIKRAADRRLIIRTPGGYIPAAKSFSKEETPTHKGGGPHLEDTRAGGTAPEAGGT
jgi:hypothetical protein